MRIRQKNDDPSLFAPRPALAVWRGWFAFICLLPLMAIFIIGLPAVTVVGLLWFTGGWEHVRLVWAETSMSSPPFLPTLGLILVAGIGAGLFRGAWWLLFVWSGFINETAFNSYFDLKRPKRLFQAVIVWVVIGGVLVWLLVAHLPG